MKRTGFKQKARKPLKRTQLKAKTPLGRATSPLKRSKLKRRSKSPLAKAKARLWELCRELTKAKYGNTCYTCGATGLEKSNYQTGHFITKSVCSAPMKYDLDNLRIQCFRCNINLSGNWPAFEAHLMVDKGRDFPNELKKRNQETSGGSYRIDWYLKQIELYEQM